MLLLLWLPLVIFFFFRGPYGLSGLGLKTVVYRLNAEGIKRSAIGGSHTDSQCLPVSELLIISIYFGEGKTEGGGGGGGLGAF